MNHSMIDTFRSKSGLLMIPVIHTRQARRLLRVASPFGPKAPPRLFLSGEAVHRVFRAQTREVSRQTRERPEARAERAARSIVVSSPGAPLWRTGPGANPRGSRRARAAGMDRPRCACRRFLAASGSTPFVTSWQSILGLPTPRGAWAASTASLSILAVRWWIVLNARGDVDVVVDAQRAVDTVWLEHQG